MAISCDFNVSTRIGGWLTGEDAHAEPAKRPMSFNPYQYAYNNPILYTDPSGLIISEYDYENEQIREGIRFQTLSVTPWNFYERPSERSFLFSMENPCDPDDPECTFRYLNGDLLQTEKGIIATCNTMVALEELMGRAPTYPEIFTMTIIGEGFTTLEGKERDLAGITEGTVRTINKNGRILTGSHLLTHLAIDEVWRGKLSDNPYDMEEAYGRAKKLLRGWIENGLREDIIKARKQFINPCDWDIGWSPRGVYNWFNREAPEGITIGSGADQVYWTGTTSGNLDFTIYTWDQHFYRE